MEDIDFRADIALEFLLDVQNQLPGVLTDNFEEKLSNPCMTMTLVQLMHQSIPAVSIPSPPPPPGNRRAFAQVVSPGGGVFEILSRPRGLGICIPRGDSRAFDTRF